MKLTVNQCMLLIDMFNASLVAAKNSGIPIGQEYYKDIDEIKEKLYQELCDRNKEVIHDSNRKTTKRT